MQENLPLWVKNHAFKSMDKQNKQLKYSAIYFFQKTLSMQFPDTSLGEKPCIQIVGLLM